MKPTLASCIIGAASFLTLLGCTHSTLAARLVDVAIVDRTSGERLTPYRHGGRLYVAGTPGVSYAVELQGRPGMRVLTVLSVDGINVLTGETAATLQSGYVIDGERSYSVTGWRKNMDDVARFVFTALPDSYAARTGRPGNVGVIGVAVYREKAAPPNSAPPSVVWRGESRSLAADRSLREAAPAAASTAASEVGSVDQRLRPELDSSPRRIGTGHGEREHAPTRYTEFVRSSDAPDEVVTIYYDSRANLIARGVIRWPRPAEPTPFPANSGFVPDPRG